MFVIEAKVTLDVPTYVAGLAQEAGTLRTPKGFLLAHPFGVYTCARAVRSTTGDGYRLVHASFHLDRLWEGFASISDDMLKTRKLCECMRLGTSKSIDSILQAAAPVLDDDIMVTVLWTGRTAPPGELGVRIHACAFPKASHAPVHVLVHGGPRTNPICKDSRWIEDRLPLEEHLRSTSAVINVPLNECILSSTSSEGDTLLHEGLITNFFVVTNGRIVTSGDNILPGSTRELVIRACRALGLPVVLESPNLSEIHSWQGAFLTSAVRILVPIASVYWHPAEELDSVSHHSFISGTMDEEVLEPLRRHVLAQWQEL